MSLLICFMGNFRCYKNPLYDKYLKLIRYIIYLTPIIICILNFVHIKPLKEQCIGIVYPSEAIQVDYVIKTNRKLSDNIRVIIIIYGKE